MVIRLVSEKQTLTEIARPATPLLSDTPQSAEDFSPHRPVWHVGKATDDATVSRRQESKASPHGWGARSEDHSMWAPPGASRSVSAHQKSTSGKNLYEDRQHLPAASVGELPVNEDTLDPPITQGTPVVGGVLPESGVQRASGTAKQPLTTVNEDTLDPPITQGTPVVGGVLPESGVRRASGTAKQPLTSVDEDTLDPPAAQAKPKAVSTQRAGKPSAADAPSETAPEAPAISSESAAQNWVQSGQLGPQVHSAVAPRGSALTDAPSGYVESAAEAAPRARLPRIDTAMEILEATVRTVSSFVPAHSALKAPRKRYTAPTPRKVEVVPSRRYERERNRLAIDGRIKHPKEPDADSQPATLELRQVAQPVPPSDSKMPNNSPAQNTEGQTSEVRGADTHVERDRRSLAELTAAQLTAPTDGTKHLTKEQRRLKTLLNCLCIFVLMWVLAIAWQFYTLYGPALTPERTATQYLDLLSNGDLEGATALVDHASKNANISNQSYAAAKRPGRYTITNVNTQGARSTATVTWTLGEKSYTSTLTLQASKTGPFRLISQWSLKSGLETGVLVRVNSISGAGEAHGVRVNGAGQEIRVRSGGDGTVIQLPPGVHSISAPVVGKYSEFGTDQVVTVGGESSLEQSMTFTESPTNALLDAAKTEAKNYLDRCLTNLDEPSCPNNLEGTWINPQRVPAYEWSLNNETYTLSSDGTKLQITGDYVLKYAYGAITETSVNAIDPNSYFHEIHRNVSQTWRVTVKGDRVVLDAT